jgi:hypothetical protein
MTDLIFWAKPGASPAVEVNRKKSVTSRVFIGDFLIWPRQRRGRDAEATRPLVTATREPTKLSVVKDLRGGRLKTCFAERPGVHHGDVRTLTVGQLAAFRHRGGREHKLLLHVARFNVGGIRPAPEGRSDADNRSTRVRRITRTHLSRNFRGPNSRVLRPQTSFAHKGRRERLSGGGGSAIWEENARFLRIPGKPGMSRNDGVFSFWANPRDGKEGKGAA